MTWGDVGREMEGSEACSETGESFPDNEGSEGNVPGSDRGVCPGGWMCPVIAKIPLHVRMWRYKLDVREKRFVLHRGQRCAVELLRRY